MRWKPEQRTEKTSVPETELLLQNLTAEQQVLLNWSEGKISGDDALTELRNRRQPLSRKQIETLSVWAEANLRIGSRENIKFFSDLSALAPTQNLTE